MTKVLIQHTILTGQRAGCNSVYLLNKEERLYMSPTFFNSWRPDVFLCKQLVLEVEGDQIQFACKLALAKALEEIRSSTFWLKIEAFINMVLQPALLKLPNDTELGSYTAEVSILKKCLEWVVPRPKYSVCVCLCMVMGVNSYVFAYVSISVTLCLPFCRWNIK